MEKAPDWPIVNLDTVVTKLKSKQCLSAHNTEMTLELTLPKTSTGSRPLLCVEDKVDVEH